jgi:hypothetical protein
VPDRHQRVYPAYRERLWHKYDCEDPATLWQPEAIHGSGPVTHDQCSNSVQYIGRRTGTRDGNTLLVIRRILLIKFIAAVLHSSESTMK